MVPWQYILYSIMQIFETCLKTNELLPVSFHFACNYIFCKCSQKKNIHIYWFGNTESFMLYQKSNGKHSCTKMYTLFSITQYNWASNTSKGDIKVMSFHWSLLTETTGWSVLWKQITEEHKHQIIDMFWQKVNQWLWGL